MYSTHNKCSRQMYDTVKQLMKLAEEDNSKDFFELMDADRDFFYSDGSFYESAVVSGLMARNKAEMLENFLGTFDTMHFDSRIPCHLAGTFIRKQLSREAVKRFIVRMSDKLSDRKYILHSAAMADDPEMFELLYNAEYDYGECLLICGIFRSKKILDRITGCGNTLSDKNMACQLYMYIHDYSYPFDNTIFSKEKAENDILIKWLKNIWLMYFDNKFPSDPYEILMKIAQNTGLVMDKNAVFCGLNKLNLIMREMYIMIMCGHKENDLTYFILQDQWYDTSNTEDAEALMKIAGDEPFIRYDEGLHIMSENIAMLPEELKSKLTVRLISNFAMSDIEILRDNVKLEMDIEDPKTAENLCSLLKPSNISFKGRNEDQRRLVKYIIDCGFGTVEKMAEIAAFAQNTDILNMLFNYGSEKSLPQSGQIRKKNKRSVIL